MMVRGFFFFGWRAVGCRVGKTGATVPGTKTTLRQVSIVDVHNNNKDGLRVAYHSEVLDGLTMAPDRATEPPCGRANSGSMVEDIPDHRSPN